MVKMFCCKVGWARHRVKAIFEAFKALGRFNEGVKLASLMIRFT